MADLTTSHARRVGLWLVGLCVTLHGISGLETYYLTDYCGESFSFRHHDVSAFILVLTRNDTYQPNMHCDVKIFAPLGYGMFFKFVFMDVPNCRDYADVYEFHIDQYESLDPEICSVSPRQPLVTSSGHAKIGFASDSKSQGRGFKVIITAFRTECSSTDFQCHNDRCINSSLVCSGFDNCGDDSNNDECDVNSAWTMVFKIGVTMLTLTSIYCMLRFWKMRARQPSRPNDRWFICPERCPSCSWRPKCPSLPSLSLPACIRHRDTSSNSANQTATVSFSDSSCQTASSSPNVNTSSSSVVPPTPDAPPPYHIGASIYGPSTYLGPPPSYEETLPPRYEDVVSK